MPTANELHRMLDELAAQQARLDAWGELVTAAHLDAAIHQLSQKAPARRTAPEME